LGLFKNENKYRKLIDVWFYTKNFISKALYEDLYSKSIFFRFLIYIKNHTWIYVAILFIMSWLIPFFLHIIYDYKPEDLGFFWPFILNIIPILLLFIFLWFFLIVTIAISTWLKINKLKKSYVSIKFNDKGSLKKSLLNNWLQIQDIFKTIQINYPWKYSCKFWVYIDCLLQDFRYESDSKKSITYTTLVDSFKIGEYTGDSLSIENIVSNMDAFYNKEKLFPMDFDWRFRISYKISYIFYSIDITEDTGSIDLFD
jgi:hypothetical protein